MLSNYGKRYRVCIYMAKRASLVAEILLERGKILLNITGLTCLNVNTDKQVGLVPGRKVILIEAVARYF